ncbi:MAG: FliH/SctL family protein [Pseudolabrys sp.]|jgi:flagellar assembly protein FliH
MKATAKYLFDEDFSSGTKPTITLVEADRRRADAESQAYRQGFSAGEKQAQDDAAERTAAALGMIADAMERLERSLAGISARLETEAVEVAVAVATKLAPELIAREPFVEISALATESFNHLVKAPHVVVHIGAEIYETAKAKLQEIANARGFEGRLVVLSDPAMVPGDCRIEWADGGVARDRAATLAVIDDVVGRYVAARASLIN